MSEVDKRVQTLEGEFKLIKGQLRQAMVDVRDFLQNLKLPAEATGYEKEPDELRIHLEGASDGFAPPQGPITGGEPVASTSSQTSGEEPFPSLPGEEPFPSMSDDMPGEKSSSSPADAAPSQVSGQSSAGDMEGEAQFRSQSPQDDMFGGDQFPPLGGMPGDQSAPPPMQEQRPPLPQDWRSPREESNPEELERARNLEQECSLEEGLPERSREVNEMKEEAIHATSQVNLLANLIRWVSVAKKDVGIEQLPIFLETYGIGGDLPPELKEGILRLADVIEEKTADVDGADAWSRLILELHGILTGGGAPLLPPSSFLGSTDESQLEEQSEGVDAANEPVRLKLVLPGGDEGQEREFSITLTPDANAKVE
jgi:hypothetical protein